MDIYGRMADVLAKKGHHLRTLDQVRAKVKELRQGYVKACEHSSHSGETAHCCAYYEDLDWILGAGNPVSQEGCGVWDGDPCAAAAAAPG